MGVGGAMYVAPSSAATLWPWVVTPLSAMAIAAWLLGFGVAAAHGAWQNDLRPFQGAALAYAALGALELVAVARYSEDLGPNALRNAAYLAFLASVLAVGTYGWVAARRTG